MPEAAITVRDVAAYLNVTEKTVYRLVQRGELPGFKVAGAWRFRRRDIDAWIEEQKRVAPSGGSGTSCLAPGSGGARVARSRDGCRT
jgi:excisionase family DNA binding protein